MGKLTSEVFSESCCDGGACNTRQESARYCGCDPAARWVCTRHQLENNMPHDKNGVVLQIGDLVIVECVVTAIHPTAEYCNLTLTTVEPMYPGDYKSGVTANSKQVIFAAHQPAQPL